MEKDNKKDDNKITKVIESRGLININKRGKKKKKKKNLNKEQVNKEQQANKEQNINKEDKIGEIKKSLEQIHKEKEKLSTKQFEYLVDIRFIRSSIEKENSNLTYLREQFENFKKNINKEKDINNKILDATNTKRKLEVEEQKLRENTGSCCCFWRETKEQKQKKKSDWNLIIRKIEEQERIINSNNKIKEAIEKYKNDISEKTKILEEQKNKLKKFQSEFSQCNVEINKLREQEKKYELMIQENLNTTKKNKITIDK